MTQLAKPLTHSISHGASVGEADLLGGATLNRRNRQEESVPGTPRLLRIAALAPLEPISLAEVQKVAPAENGAWQPRGFLKRGPRGKPDARNEHRNETRSSSRSREDRIRVPVVYFSRGTLPPKKGKRALLGDLGKERKGRNVTQGSLCQCMCTLYSI